MAFDLVVRGGTVVDGSGSPRRRADVAVVDGRIAAVGVVEDRGREELDAEGLVVAPGFVDAHTHMDAQVFWDELGTSSCWHGVTTVVMGNCGFTLAPARPDARALVVRNLERAEDIAAEAMAAGITWTWATYAQYLDAVEATPKGLNYAGQIGHSALRTWAMGERAFSEAATPDDLEVMAAELGDALRAGAVGFSTSRSQTHTTSDDRPVASRQASWDEVVALVDVVARAGDRTFQIAPERHATDEGRREYGRRLQRLALDSGVPITYGGFTAQNTELVDDTVAKGGRMTLLTHCRGVGSVGSFRTRLPFDWIPEWHVVRQEPIERQLQLLRDPEVKTRLVHAANHADYGTEVGLTQSRKPNFDWTLVMESPYLDNPSVAAAARARGVDPVELMIDLALERDFDVFFVRTLADRDDDHLLAMMKNPNTAMTFSDAGAHVGTVIDSSIQSYLLAYWVREREALTLEEAVNMMTWRSAQVFRLSDRGMLREGFAADMTVFDPAAVAPDMPRLVNDLPGGGRRLVQTATGYRAAVVNGEVLLRDGEPTGARPGQLLRAGLGRPARR